MTTPESQAAKLLGRTITRKCGGCQQNYTLPNSIVGPESARCPYCTETNAVQWAKIVESDAAALLGRKGGRSKSEAKQAAARDNGKRGGNPHYIRCVCGHYQVAHIAGVCGVCECADFRDKSSSRQGSDNAPKAPPVPSAD